MTKRVLIVATDGFEQSELEGPKQALEDAGIETVVASLKPGSITGWKDKNWGDAVAVNITLDEVDAKEYDALLLPGHFKAV